MEDKTCKTCVDNEDGFCDRMNGNKVGMLHLKEIRDMMSICI